MKFNIPYLTGKEKEYVSQAIDNRNISGDGAFTKKCQDWFEKKFGFKKTFLTTSCTDALEMAAILLDIKAGDEVIVPSFTFVSTANAFLLRGARIVFADSCSDSPNMDADKLESLITKNTKVILIMHYAGFACDMEKIMSVANKHNLYVVEDAALALGSNYKGKSLGSFGHLSAFSFHETKNISCGEGGMLVVNDEQFIKRAEIIREKGTNRSAFFRGEVDKYGWTDIGSSFLPSDLLAAYLFAQLEAFEVIQNSRMKIWNLYYEGLKGNKNITLPASGNHNASIFYFTCRSLEDRTKLIAHLKQNNIPVSFHYQALHKSSFAASGDNLPNSEKYSDTLVRLPLYVDLKESEVNTIISTINSFYN
ncbi:MAG: dTDP-4-amino-4,6-dideoxygalactose transaminase [Sphingobacteriaceae bacterium]|nr:dTDP-4-amino-4,6-dideoxygalactose transaminase [Sphingobacteriaceae bacterium]